MVSEEALLRKADLFQGLGQGQLEEIGKIAKTTKHEAGDVLFKEGSLGDSLYIVKRGTVRIDLKLAAKSDCTTVHRLRSSQILGELSLVDSRRRSATATCESQCEVVSLDCSRLLELFEQDKSIGYTVILNLVRIVASRLRKTNLQLIATVCWE